MNLTNGCRRLVASEETKPMD